jgi:hypothetical protein
MRHIQSHGPLAAQGSTERRSSLKSGKANGTMGNLPDSGYTQTGWRHKVGDEAVQAVLAASFPGGIELKFSGWRPLLEAPDRHGLYEIALMKKKDGGYDAENMIVIYVGRSDSMGGVEKRLKAHVNEKKIAFAAVREAFTVGRLASRHVVRDDLGWAGLEQALLKAYFYWLNVEMNRKPESVLNPRVLVQACLDLQKPAGATVHTLEASQSEARKHLEEQGCDPPIGCVDLPEITCFSPSQRRQLKWKSPAVQDESPLGKTPRSPLTGMCSPRKKPKGPASSHLAATAAVAGEVASSRSAAAEELASSSPPASGAGKPVNPEAAGPAEAAIAKPHVASGRVEGYPRGLVEIEEVQSAAQDLLDAAPAKNADIPMPDEDLGRVEGFRDIEELQKTAKQLLSSAPAEDHRSLWIQNVLKLLADMSDMLPQRSPPDFHP